MVTRKDIEVFRLKLWIRYGKIINVRWLVKRKQFRVAGRRQSDDINNNNNVGGCR